MKFIALDILEYDRETLDREYKRDVKVGKNPNLPEHYYLNDDPAKMCQCTGIWQQQHSLVTGLTMLFIRKPHIHW